VALQLKAPRGTAPTYRQMKTLPALALTLVFAAGVVNAQQGSQFDVFGAYLDALRVQARIPGLSAAIVEDGEIVWERGLGLADVDGQVPATPDTPYRIASLTKTFTSTLLLRCVEEGRLSLDEPIARYSSAIPEPGATVRHVLTHTSAGTPGAAYRYDGNRFGSLTPVVEACTGLPYRKALSTSILDRLAMRDSVPGQDLEAPGAAVASLFDETALERYRDVLTRIATPYVLGSDGRVRTADYPPKTINASAGLVSTVRDLAKYDAALDAGILVTPDSLAQAWTAATANNRTALPYGLGWFVQNTAGVRVVWHYGQWEQFSALYLKLPDAHRTLILLANSGELSTRFNLAAGDVTESPFARLFLRIFGS
jgi:CubicO group peptidase (beta-lactamase class C family)